MASDECCFYVIAYCVPGRRRVRSACAASGRGRVGVFHSGHAGRNDIRVGADPRRRDGGAGGAVVDGDHRLCKAGHARRIEGTLHRVFLPIMLRLPINLNSNMLAQLVTFVNTYSQICQISGNSRKI